MSSTPVSSSNTTGTQATILNKRTSQEMENHAKLSQMSRKFGTDIGTNIISVTEDSQARTDADLKPNSTGTTSKVLLSSMLASPAGKAASSVKRIRQTRGQSASTSNDENVPGECNQS